MQSPNPTQGQGRRPKPTGLRHDWKKPRVGEVIGGGYIVARRGDSTGRVRASAFPYEFDNLPDAEVEAAKLASQFSGETFTVWAQVSGAFQERAPGAEASEAA
ncbi:hypothetical protein [Rubellimicrobium arenae]|uniref:hypothetical protein n=1 Tax=Rubellimicrobium arenae TaxID=2817372 RepID=UPI001B311A12|nr:hypothetical protein [Rubellimicrobium arenae]